MNPQLSIPKWILVAEDPKLGILSRYELDKGFGALQKQKR
jgi:hypothetical protein